MRQFFTKAFFIFLISLTAVFLVAGVSFSKDNPYFAPIYLKSRLDSLAYKIRFALTANISAEVINNSLRAEAEDIPVLVYHGIIKARDGSNVVSENFEEQMLALKKSGWQTVTTDDLYGFLTGEKKLPDKSFVLTFDDGRKDSYYPTDPILDALNYNAVIFVITKFSIDLKSQYYLDKWELAQMVKSGRWEIESHSKSGHEPYIVSADGEIGQFFSNRLWLEDEKRTETEEEYRKRIKEDLLASKQEIESTLGTSVLGFAFPLGDFGNGTINFTKAPDIMTEETTKIYPLSFYQYATEKRFTSNYPKFNSIKENNFFVKRIEVLPDWTGEDLMREIEKSRSKDLPYYDNFSKDNGWVKTWGEISVGDGRIRMNPVGGDTGSGAILDGTLPWKDYKFTVKTEEFRGSSVYLWARFKDDNNFVACNFGPDRVHIDAMRNGFLNVIKGEKKNNVALTGEFEASIEVRGRDVECFINGESMVKTEFLDPSLDKGGIGIKAWDREKNASKLVVKSVAVTP